MQQLIDFIRQYAPMSTSDWGRVATYWEPFAVEEQGLILREGEVCRHLYFLERGLLKFCVYPPDGREVVKFFTEPPYCFTSQWSFTRREPARERMIGIPWKALLGGG